MDCTAVAWLRVLRCIVVCGCVLCVSKEQNPTDDRDTDLKQQAITYMSSKPNDKEFVFVFEKEVEGLLTRRLFPRENAQCELLGLGLLALSVLKQYKYDTIRYTFPWSTPQPIESQTV